MNRNTPEDLVNELLSSNRSIAQDTMEDGFTTLHTKEGVPYIANLDPEEKARYSETKIPLSKIKKDGKGGKELTTGKKDKKADIDSNLTDLQKKIKARAEGEKAPEPVKDPEFEKYIESLKNTKIKGFFGRIKDMNKAILNDIEERGINTMEGVNQLLKEKYPGRLPSARKPEIKEPETKEPEKKEDDSKTIEGYLLKNGGKLWNDRRIYMKEEAKKWLGVKDDYYKTGNLRYFEWEDGKESNSYGRKVLSAIDSSYFDIPSQTFKAESYSDPELAQKVAEKLNEKAKEMGLTVKEKPVITGNTVKDQIRRFVVDGWNGKVYRYKNGDNAIFVNNQKILLTKEQLDYIDSKDKK